MIEKICGPKWKDVTFSSLLTQCFFFLAKTYFDMCFDNLIKFYITSLMYGTSHIILAHLYLYKHVLNNMGIYLSKEKRNLDI